MVRFAHEIVDSRPVLDRAFPPVTPEVAGSSPVDPANYFKVFHTSGQTQGPSV